MDCRAGLGRKKLFDSLKFLGKFEAQLSRLVVWQPGCHLREHYLVVPMRATVPRCCVLSFAGNTQDLQQLGANNLWVDRLIARRFWEKIGLAGHL